MKEEWRDIQEYKGLYQVSNFGQVKSLFRYKKTLSPHMNTWGYVQVGLCKNGEKKYFQIHRLVAQAFIPNPHNKPQIDHIDGSRDNNSVSNLRWVTASENQKNPISIARKSEAQKGRILSNETRNKISKKNSRPIIQFNLDGNEICRYESIKDASKTLGFAPNGIQEALKGRYKQSHGFMWKYQ